MNRCAVRLVSVVACTWCCASRSTECANWSGKWYVEKGKGGPGVFPIAQSGCNVTINNGQELTYYVATANSLECRPKDVQGSLCTQYYRNVSSGSSNPATMILYPAAGPGKTTATSPGGDSAWRKQWTPGPCPQPSTDCDSRWGGSWKTSVGNPARQLNYTLTQNGCNVTKLEWSISSGGSFQSATHYTACGNMIIPDNQDLDVTMLMSEDGKSATCPAPCSWVWAPRAPDPPQPPLPSCLPLGGCPIMFADGTKPPCCDKGAVLVREDAFGPCNGRVGPLGYPTDGNKCAKCLPLYEPCDDQPKGCCPGMTCVSQGISGSLCMGSTATNATDVFYS